MQTATLDYKTQKLHINNLTFDFAQTTKSIWVAHEEQYSKLFSDIKLTGVVIYCEPIIDDSGVQIGTRIIME